MDRAQFLQGLRTGGPRSTSYGNGSLSANPSQTRFASGQFQPGFGSEQELVDQFSNVNLGSANAEVIAAARLQQQQQQQYALLHAQAQVAVMIAQQGGGPSAEAQALQMQMELARFQALQQQQSLQAQLYLQQQMQQQLRQAPSTAGPFQSSFPDAAAAQTRTAAAAQLLARAAGREATMRASALEEQAIPSNPPMTAGVGGKFGNPNGGLAGNAGNRSVSSSLNPNAAAFVGRFNPDLSAAIAAATARPASTEVGTPATPTYGSTTVISGGTSLGSPGGALTPSNSYNGLSGYNNSAATGAPTMSDTVTNWRRGSNASTPTGGLSKAPSPPSSQRSLSPPGSNAGTPTRLNLSTSNLSSQDAGGRNSAISPLRARPSPLRFTAPGDGAAIAVGGGVRAGSPSNSNDEVSLNEDLSSNKSSPIASTPPSSAGSTGVVATRDEASKQVYEGLGLGRPVASIASVVVPQPAVIYQKVEPVRQPMGPPGSVEELGSRNFATRTRKRVLIGIVDAAQRREAAAVMNAASQVEMIVA